MYRLVDGFPTPIILNADVHDEVRQNSAVNISKELRKKGTSGNEPREQRNVGRLVVSRDGINSSGRAGMPEGPAKCPKWRFMKQMLSQCPCVGTTTATAPEACSFEGLLRMWQGVFSLLPSMFAAFNSCARHTY